LSTRKKTPIQQAIINLRERLHLTQQQLAMAMNVTVVSVCRWETSRPPAGFSLVQLMDFARRSGAADLADIFEKAVWGDIHGNVSPERQYIVLRIPGRAPETALNELRAAKDHPLVGPEYRKVLRDLEHGVKLLEKVLAGDPGASELLRLTRRDLEEELEHEEKRTKTQS
jgi:transcriptional regulator with XRE-family HTH domain